MSKSAILLAHGLFRTPFAKTSHGLIRGPSRYPIAAVVDPDAAGHDAGELVDARRRDIPIVASLEQAWSEQARSQAPDAGVVIVGVATPGGVLPTAIRNALLAAAAAGLDLVNGLHQPLADDGELARVAAENGATIVDIRKPKPIDALRFFTGEVFELETPRVAVLGTDCAVGKRTTAGLLRKTLSDDGLATELIYTGQTGWLQGYDYGFIFDSTPNDFVCGELEGALLACATERAPDLMLIEGQSGLRNPSGPCGAEFLLSAAAAGVVLQHAPGRRYYEGLEAHHCAIPPLADEIELIGRYGVEVWAVTLHDEGLEDPAATRDALASELDIPVVLPVTDGVAEVAEALRRRLAPTANHSGVSE